MKKGLLLIIFISLSALLFSQTTQTIRGKIVDKESQYPIIGANVIVITDTTTLKGASTDINGKYRIKEVSLGRHKVKISFMGYKDRVISVIVNSGKELIINMELEESYVEMEAVEITANSKNRGVKNEMALVSVTSFSVEETEKYAGSRGDPARMASNFAGVQGSDDSRNDIVVRGNSPLGVLWRVDGIDIPNPSHFSIAGSSGGPVSIINNKVMANSDFFTGAFPAEYGNSISGVFDLKLRNGNNEKHEFSGQFGFLGTEIMAEGPLSKKSGSSYLLAYRYSTLSYLGKIGLKLGTDAIPNYQDLSFKLNFPQKKGGTLSFFGISGISNIDIVLSDAEKPDPDQLELYGQQDRDQYFGTGMAIVGMTYMKPLSTKAFWKTTISGSIENQSALHNYFIRHVDSTSKEYVVDDIYTILDYNFRQYKYSIASFFNKKINKQDVLKFGINADMYVFDFRDSLFRDQALPRHWDLRWNHQGNAFLLQPFIQLKHKFSETFVMNFGLHSQIFSLSKNTTFIEPRVGLKWNMDEKQTLNAGLGMHSQMQPTYTYFYQTPTGNGNEKIQQNQAMDFTKSFHAVLGYSNAISRGFFLKSEVYYQYLYNIPVTITPSSFSMVNQGGGFGRMFPEALQNSGTGTNIGLELTIEKYFSKSFFSMLTGAIYDSKYKGSDGIERNTSYNGNFAVNLLVGKEFKIGEKGVLSFGTKISWAGGKRYGLVDTLQSALAKEVIFQDEQFNEFQFKNYFRADLKINYRLNTKHLTHEFGLDLVNLFGIKNLLSLTYAPTPDNPTRITENPQLGFLPLFYYRVDF